MGLSRGQQEAQRIAERVDQAVISVPRVARLFSTATDFDTMTRFSLASPDISPGVDMTVVGGSFDGFSPGGLGLRRYW